MNTTIFFHIITCILNIFLYLFTKPNVIHYLIFKFIFQQMMFKMKFKLKTFSFTKKIKIYFLNIISPLKIILKYVILWGNV